METLETLQIGGASLNEDVIVGGQSSLSENRPNERSRQTIRRVVSDRMSSFLYSRFMLRILASYMYVEIACHYKHRGDVD